MGLFDSNSSQATTTDNSNIAVSGNNNDTDRTDVVFHKNTDVGGYDASTNVTTTNNTEVLSDDVVLAAFDYAKYNDETNADTFAMLAGESFGLAGNVIDEFGDVNEQVFDLAGNTLDYSAENNRTAMKTLGETAKSAAEQVARAYDNATMTETGKLTKESMYFIGGGLGLLAISAIVFRGR